MLSIIPTSTFTSVMRIFVLLIFLILFIYYLIFYVIYLITIIITSIVAINVSSIKLIFPITVPNDMTTEIPDKSDVTKLQIKLFFNHVKLCKFLPKRQNARKISEIFCRLNGLIFWDIQQSLSL